MIPEGAGNSGDRYFLFGRFIERMLSPRKQLPEPPVMTRLTGSPVLGS